MKYLPLALFCCIAIAVFFGTGCRDNHKQQQADTSGYYISTASQSDKRVSDLGLDKRSEDASFILDTNKLEIPKGNRADGIITDTVKGEIIKEFDKDAVITLQSDTPWNGVLVWDVLQCLGLKWGDGDLFHWENHNRNFGDGDFFSVMTSTDPGYFLPENIKSGKMKPGDLKFGFVIPRNADPVHVYAMMIQAVKYCQKKLGGKILGEDQQPLDEAKAEKDMKVLVKAMKDRGLIPGSDKALMTYD